MSLPETKLEKFTSAILKDAEEQRSKVLSEIEEYRKSELAKAEEEVLHEAYIMIQNEIAAVKNAHSKQISLAELDSRKKLLKLREDITAEVFRASSEKILGFTKTDGYKDYIAALLRKCAKELPDGYTVIYVKKDDLPLKDFIIQTFSRPADCQADDSIVLGGVIVFNKDKGVVLDETLDLRLGDQKDWFAAASKLSIG